MIRRFLGRKAAVNTIPNTFIGGVASTIPDAQSLATKLGISVNDIGYFGIVGTDIEATIDVNYPIPYNCWNGNTAITYYKEKNEGRCTDTGINGFNGASNLEEVDFIGDVSINQSAFISSGLKRGIFRGSTSMYYYQSFGITSTELLHFQSLKFRNGDGTAPSLPTFGAAKNVYIPIVEQLGNTQGNENHFSNCPSGVKIWANPFLQTSNVGAEEGDLAYARANKAAIITYGTNSDLLTPPNQITDLSAGTVSGTGVQLNFTAPAGSANTIDSYEVYANGIYKNKIQGSGGYCAGLIIDTTYTFEVKPVDIYYNKSTSNKILQTTANAYSVDTTPILSYYKLETNAVDNVGGKNGTANAMSYAGGYAIFSGSGNIVLPANILNNPTEFSFSFLVQTDDTASEYRVLVLNNNTGSPYALIRLNSGGIANKIDFLIYDGTSVFISTTSIPVTNLNHIGISAINNGSVDLYINGNNIGSGTIGTFTQAGSLGNTIGSSRSGTLKLKGKMRGVAIWNKRLIAAEHSEIAAKQLSGEQLI